MKKFTALAFVFSFFSAIWSFAQPCTYVITGQVTDAQTNQFVPNHPIFVYWGTGVDTLLTNPNGVYHFTYSGPCDSLAVVFDLQTGGCGVMTSTSVTVANNQSVTQNLTICNGQPTCSSTAQVTSNSNTNTVQYSWTGSGSGGATPQVVVWDMGDGYVTNNYPNGGSYTYANPGVYQVCVTVSWSNGCTSTDCETVTVGSGGSCPYIISGHVTNGTNSQAVNGTTVTANLPPAAGGGSYTATTNANGYYVITVVGPCNIPFNAFVSATGCNVLSTATVNITPNVGNYTQNLTVCNPTADTCYSVVNAQVNGNVVQFSWTGASANGASVQSVLWNFGNGTSSNNYPNGGSWTYPNAGTYTICATVTWSSGCVSTSCTTVVVGNNNQQSICGCVNYVNSSNDTLHAGCGTAYLIALDSTNTVLVVDSTTITPNGYCFYGNYAGNYTVWAQPCAALSISEGVLPTYLGNVLFWQNASNAAFGTGGYSANCITLLNGQNSQGPAQLGGTILWGDDKAPGDPVVGIHVFLLDENGDPVAESVTDAEGYYSFGNLAYGTYQIRPEFPGYTTYPAFVTLTPETPNVEADDFYLGFGVFATAGIEESVVDMGGLYPNPAEDMAVLSLHSKEDGLARLNVTDITGKMVSASAVSIVKGQQNITLNLQDITSGVYTVTLTLNGQQIHAKLIKK